MSALARLSLLALTLAVATAAGGCDSNDNNGNNPPPSPDLGSVDDLTPPPPPSPLAVQILAINDFHGNLAPPQGSGGKVLAPAGDPQAPPDVTPTPPGGPTELVPAGGAGYLAAHIKALRARNPNTVVVSSGDLTGASPLVSAVFHDEPSVLLMNALGLDFNGVGNHEFDHGLTELFRLQYGGCHPIDGCTEGLPYPGAAFQYLAANVDVGPGRTAFPRYGIKEFGGEKLAFIGMTLEGTASIVSAQGIAGVTFDDEIKTVNALIPELKQKGVSAIIILIHQGGTPDAGSTYEKCNLSGPIVDIAKGLDPAVDVILSAHTHQAYSCTINGKLVTSAASFGRLITSVDLTIDRGAHKVTAKTAAQHIVTRTITPDVTVQAIVDHFTMLAAPRANRVVGHITADLTMVPVTSGEEPLGDVIADGMLAAARAPNPAAAVLALMNPGGVRADITYAPASGEKPGEVTYAKAFTTQPFSNNLVTLTLTGAQIKTILEQQWTASTTKILQVSAGFSYSYSAAAPIGARVDASTIKLNGVLVDPAQSYRVVTNNFLSTGGDGFAGFIAGTNILTGIIDVDALIAYFGANDPLAPPATGRITQLP